MKKAIGKDYRTVLRYLPKLESCNLIQLSRTESSKKKGKDRKIYKITLRGIIELLKVREHKTKDFVDFTDKMAVLHPTLLPLVFGKWQLFDENQKILLSLNLEDFVRQAPSQLNTLTVDTKALYTQLEEENRANAEKLGQKLPDSENLETGSFSIRTAEGIKKVATGKAALETLVKTICGGNQSLSALEKEVTKRVLSDWKINITIDQQGNLLIDKLVDDYFQALRKDNELRNYIDRELSDSEDTIKIRLHVAQKFNQWWRNLKP
jgi:DNA-binding PadR family transcriptional regulator